MEGRKSPSSPTAESPKVNVKLYSPKSVQVNLPKNTKNKAKFNTLKVKILSEKLKQLKQSPRISKISKEIANSVLHKSPAKSPYAKKIISNNRFIKSISSASTKSHGSYSDYPNFAVLNKNVNLKLTPQGQSLIIKNSKSDLFTKGILMLKKKEESLEIQRKISFEASLDQCTFSPMIKKNQSSSSIFRSKSTMSVPISSNGKKLEILREKSKYGNYKSFSPTPKQYSYASGCNLQIITENGLPLFRYLAMKMPNP